MNRDERRRERRAKRLRRREINKRDLARQIESGDAKHPGPNHPMEESSITVDRSRRPATVHGSSNSGKPVGGAPSPMGPPASSNPETALPKKTLREYSGHDILMLDTEAVVNGRIDVKRVSLERIDQRMIELGLIPKPRFDRDGRPIPVTMSDVEPVELPWSWPGRIALRKVHFWCGANGVGKSLVVSSLVGAITSGGRWPDGAPVGDPSEVLILQADDDLPDVLLPRFKQSGADLSKVHVLTPSHCWGSERALATAQIKLARDIERLETFLKAHPTIRHVFVDPCSAFLSRGNERGSSPAVRAELGLLKDLAERRNVAVILISELPATASTRAPLVRPPRGVGFEMSRIAYGFYRDPDDGERILMLPLKNNVAPRGSGLAFQIFEGAIEWDPELVDVAPYESVPARGGPQSEKLGEAVDWLREVLSFGPVDSAEVEWQAGNAGISARTLKRARAELGAKAIRDAATGKWRVAIGPGVAEKGVAGADPEGEPPAIAGKNSQDLSAGPRGPIRPTVSSRPDSAFGPSDQKTLQIPRGPSGPRECEGESGFALARADFSSKGAQL